MKRIITTCLGVLGLSLGCLGSIAPPASSLQKWLLFANAALLVAFALLERSPLFVALEIMAVIGAIIAFFPLALAANLLLMLGVCAVIISVVIRLKLITAAKEIFAVIGLGLVACGFGLTRIEHLFLWMFFLGAISISIYSYQSIRAQVRVSGIRALTGKAFAPGLFFVLNVVFMGLTGIGILRLWLKGA